MCRNMHFQFSQLISYQCIALPIHEYSGHNGPDLIFIIYEGSLSVSCELCCLFLFLKISPTKESAPLSIPTTEHRILGVRDKDSFVPTLI